MTDPKADEPGRAGGAEPRGASDRDAPPRASATAVGVAVLRAAHQLLDATPKVLEDPVILRLLDPEVLDGIRRHRERYETPEARGLRSHVVLRSRYAEDRLAGAVARGVRQYVILGAGLDTFAYRQPPWAAGVRVFEVDQPASQAAKRERLRAAGVAPPPNLAFVEADFERVALRDMLRGAGFADDQPAFVSWLGVTMYLTEPAIDAVFRFVASLPRSSEIAFTFASRDAVEEPAQRSIADAAARVGEPFLTWFEPAALEQKLRGFGFAEVSFLTPRDATERYLRDRPDGLPAPRRTKIASAVV